MLKNMADRVFEYFFDFSEVWHCNLVDTPSFTNAFIEKMASENLPVKETLTRGYKFFHKSYIHDVEGKLPFFTVKLAKEEEGRSERNASEA